MNTLAGYFDAAYTSWFGTAASCCSTPQDEKSGRPHSSRNVERPMRVEHHQPYLVPPPIPEPQERPTTRGREWVGKTRAYASRASSRGSFSVRRRLNAYNGPRRPRIGAPTDFRHVGQAIKSRNISGNANFRPLELSIYAEEPLSPILPHFGSSEDAPSMPRPTSFICHSRSNSAMSFSIPRKPLRSSSRASSDWTAQFKPRPDSLSADELLAKLETDMPRAPPPARLRATTEPPAYERIKSALHEKFELDQKLKDIDEVIEERRSVYFNSRPTSRATSHARSIYSTAQEPMPSPAPFKPSFAARVASPNRGSTTTTTIIQHPQTAPSKAMPSRLQTTSLPPSSPQVPSPPPKSPLRARGHPLPPPLPLILVQPKQANHPPLRKKKSFSRVSNWLFPSSVGSHSRVSSLDSVTNTPRPVTSRDGFYQCVDIPQNSYHKRRDSISSVSTVSTLSTITTTLSEDFPNRDTNATITPESSPGRTKRSEMKVFVAELSEKRDEETSLELERMRTFGEEQRWRGEMNVARNSSVGVAF